MALSETKGESVAVLGRVRGWQGNGEISRL